MRSEVVNLVCPVFHNNEKFETVEIREMTGHEEDIIVNVGSKLTPTQKLHKVIENCIVRVGNRSDNLSELVNKLSVSNVLYLLLRLRILSLGKDYAFSVECPNCNKKISVTVDLNDLEVKKAIIDNPDGVEVKLSDGRVAKLNVMTIADELKINNYARRTDSASYALAGRLVSIDNQRVGLPDIKNLTMSDRNLLRQQIEKLEGGFDDEIDVPCSECNEEFITRLDIGTKNFFIPES